MISSAVVIPDPEESRLRNGDASPTLKRKISLSLDHDRKRPRIDTNIDSLDYDEAKPRSPPQLSSAKSQPKSASVTTSATSPNQRRSSAIGSAVDEKKRNQRLFGGLLGVVSGSTARSNPAHKKRDEIEARARERLKRENEEQEEARSRRKAEIEQRRRNQQKAWDEESMRIRHRNMRDMAVFLRTKSKPLLYYKPWELRPEEEETIERQKREAEEQIRKELGQDEPEDRVAGSDRHSTSHHGEESLVTETKLVDVSADPEPDVNEGPGNGTSPVEQQEGQPPDDDHPSTAQASSDDLKPDESPITSGNADTHKEDDHHDGELVEGQEDDVIY